MAYVLTNIGEEWYTETALDGASISVGLYNDSNDSVAVGNDLSDITEPGGSDYSRQSDTVTVLSISGDWGFDNDSTLSFNVGDASMTIDSVAIVASFDSDEAGDGGTATNHLIGTSGLSQSHDLSQVNSLDIVAGEVGITISS